MPLITLSVNTTIDENDGISSGQGISLRDAILAANADPTNEYVIVLQGGSTHTLSLSNSNGDEEGGLTGDLDIAAGARISIVTSDGSKATINAAGIAGGDRAFDVLANGRLSLNNVEITGGNSQDSGGAISIAKDATVVVENSIIKNNTAAIDGGAIYNKGNLSVSQSSIEDNKALVGSGIANYNSATVSNSSITGNDAISGGAVYNRDSFTLTNTTVTGNTATFGGAFYNVGDDLNITGSTISDNDAFVAGGGVYNNGRAKIEQSNLTDNISGVRGGGIINLESGNLVVLSSNVSGGESKTGGGIDNTGTFAFINSTLNNNIAENGGGLNNSSSGKATLINATIGGNGALSNGGGIANSAQLNITNGTIANNTSDGDGNGSGVGGGIFNAGGSATLKNTLVAQNVGNDLSGSFRGNANNLIGNTIGASGTIGTGSDIINGTPFIGPLQDNGNGILTYMPLVGSSAIDKGNNAFLPQDTFDIDGDGDVSEIIPLDSKGGNRIVNGAVDIGAIEFVPENRGIPNITVNPVSGLFTNENGSTAQFTVVLNSQPTSDVTIALNSSDTTEGTISTSAITFTPANWNVAQTVTVTGADDDFADGSVPFTIVTAAAVSADAGYNGLNAVDVSATNNDNETAGITVSQTSGLVTDENGSTAQFTVVLNSQPTSDVTIALNSSDTTEGTISTSAITFTPANWNIAQTVTVTGADDDFADGSVPFTIVTAAAVSADTGYNGLNAADVSATNNDNETAGITVNPVSGLFTNENGSTAQFTVVLNSQPTSDVTIALNSSDTTEGTISTSAITFTPANWNVAQTVTVTGADDDFADGSVPFTIVTAAAVSADAGYNGLNAADVSATNNDNETAGITVSQTSGLVTDENGSTAQFTVVLNSQPTSDVTIALNSSDTTEGTISTSSITFTPANWNIAQTVTVEGINDPDVDGDIAYTIVTAATVSADSNYNGLDVADISLVNNDNDGAPVTVEAPTIPADKPGVISFDKLPDLDFSTFNPFGSPSEDGSDSEPAFRIDRVGDLPSNGGLRAAPQLAAATASEGIKGSFVKDSTTDNLTFAKTGEPMGSGIYQMTLNTDGMLDEDGNPIDGDGDGNPGGDFVLEFPVDNRGKRAFSLEDFVAGPGQSVKLPSSGGRGIDIDIDDATGLTKIEFDFVFDEDILGVSGVSRGANLPDSWNISSELESPGRLQVVLEGTEAIQGGAAQLVNVVADVLPTAVYGSSGLLQLDRIELNDGAIGSVGDVGVHSVGKLGDLNNDGKYTSLDASLLSRVVQGIDSSFATNPLIDGNILGDTNSTDSLTSEDALSVAKKVVGIPQNDIL
jgi:hypothetical protein